MSTLAGVSVLVTGGTGFLGRRVCARLVERGAVVHVLARPGSRSSVLNCVTHVHNGTMEGMQSVLAAVRPQIAFHLAAAFVAEHRATDVTPLIESNILLGAQLVDAAVEVGCRRIVTAGTVMQHYLGRDYDPVCLYAATKEAFEAILRFYEVGRGIRVVSLRLADTYGEEDSRRKVLNLLVDAGLSGQKLAMSAGEQLLDWVHVSDAAEAFVLAGERTDGAQGGTQETFSVVTGRPIRLKDAVELLRRSGLPELDVEWGAREYRPREQMSPSMPWNVVPGWAPKVSLEDGLRMLIADRRSRLGLSVERSC